MKYLPILQELFKSDTVFFLLAGLIIALFTGLRFGNREKCGVSAGVSAVISAGCELISNFNGNYLTQFFFRCFWEPAALGCFTGFLICFFRPPVSKKQGLKSVRHGLPV